MSLTVIAAFEAKSGYEDRLRTALEGMIEPSLDEAGCLAYDPYTDPNNPRRMVIVEEWTGRDALDFHFTTPHFHHVRDVLDLVLAKPFTIRYLHDA
ncbi:antibiotic biosynthesis monooxygenase [Nonomuraea sp. NBC_01738]|uniref:putative quinol monooxygenase n=1 Tax=Nonomuraea sp. NBC_01738 TaxID=2976003 RepID=UPI002E125660|nr:antibiotic biosynthesis monooxygenase [Nonomuraea sp. NBC_01738]